MARATKFGAISGVFTPSILTILGVIMYLRLPWIVGQAGLWATIGIILVAHIISFSTGLSVSSIATDKRVETGGSYYIISRSLGLPIGGTLGLALFTGLSFSVSLYLIGFSEVFLNYTGFETSLTNIRITGIAALLALTILTFISTSLAIRAQYIILAALALSLVSIFMGNTSFTPDRTLLEPMSGSLPWITLFAIFFPAVTGFEAGVSMSGDLKDPRRSIPIGTITAVLVGMTVYLALAFYFAHFIQRDLLVNDPSVLFKIAWIPQLVVAGIMGATLSSALGSILGAPRILQATSLDRITPSILGKGFGASNEPRSALIFTFTIALAGILIGELNVIARIVTIFFIITYGFLNITYAVESWAGADFQPTFRIPWIISLIGAITCVVVMIQLDLIALIAASLLLFGVFLFLKKRELTLHTGDTWNSVWASLVKTGLTRLFSARQQTRNWRPNIILFTGGAKKRPYLIDAAQALVGKLGVFTIFELIENQDEKNIFSKKQQISARDALQYKGIFYRKHICHNLYEGMENVARIYGMAGFEPNTILMGWPRRNGEGIQKLVKRLKKLDLNLVFLNYNHQSEFGWHKQIDFWWSGKGRNISFAITLLKFILSSPLWRSANIRILIINSQANLDEKYYQLLKQVLENSRMKAEIRIINNTIEKLPAKDIIRAESMNSDLAIIELDESHEDAFTRINQITEHLPSTLILSASSFFEEHNIIGRPLNGKKIVATETGIASFQVTSKLQLADKVIVANEIFNLSHRLETITSDYFNHAYENIKNNASTYFESLITLVEKTTSQLYQATSIEDSKDMKGELLRIINDFSFHSQNILRQYKDEFILFQENELRIHTDKYINELEQIIAELPQKIRIRYNWKEYSKIRVHSFRAAVLRMIKIAWAQITGGEASHTINVSRSAKTHIFNKRLTQINEIHHNLVLHSLDTITGMRNVISGVNELVDKGIHHNSSRSKTRNVIHLEKDRLRIAISLLAEQNNLFYNNTGLSLEKEILANLQQFNDHLASLSNGNGSKGSKKNTPQVHADDILEFPRILRENTSLFLNKIILDFSLQSLRYRIETKIRKFNYDFYLLTHSSMLLPMSVLQAQLADYLRTKEFTPRPDKDAFSIIPPEQHFAPLFDEVTTLIDELPAEISIPGDDITTATDENNLQETPQVLISVRKTVGFSFASEFVNHIRKQLAEASLSMTKSVHRIKDYVRLINFNLDADETDDTPQLEKQLQADDFLDKIKAEENNLKQLLINIETSFSQGLNNTFAPLSASLIAKSSGNIQRNLLTRRKGRMIDQVVGWKNNFTDTIRNKLVRLVYSKSESILWMGKLEKPLWQQELNNEEVFSWLDTFSPRKEVLSQLPFYYTRLFSGQSGIGDDFWVGMKDEIAMADVAVKRFNDGRPGCIIVSGARNSGKTSLSKYIARKHFQASRVHNIRAPRECAAEVQLLENFMLKSLDTANENLYDAIDELNHPTVFIINDLELWWERRNKGTAVIEHIMWMVKKYHQKILFIINLNTYSLKLINKLTGLQSWSLGMIYCNGFDARELHEMILIRHHAGGLKFVLDKKEEDNMTSWQYAALFNHYFDISGGNPGMAIRLWIASIYRVTGKTIFMHKPVAHKADFLEKLSRTQVLLLIQFIYHIRLSIKQLASNLHTDPVTLENQILNLWQTGILMEKFPGVYTINPAIQLPLEQRFREMKLL